MKTIGLSPDTKVQIISAYSAPMMSINSVVSNPTYVVAGAFYMAATQDAILDVIGLVSGAGRTLRVRLYDLTLAAPVDNASVDITATVPTRAISNPVPLLGQHLYQWQMEVFGSSTGTGTLYTATLD